MTATSAGSSNSCLTAKGLEISLAALQRQDPYINNIVDVASQVALYTYNNRANEWEKTEVEGTLFIYTRLASPRHGFTIMNRLSMENLTEPITKDLDFQLQHPFLLYRNARLVIHGIWFYDKEDCQRIAQRMKILTQHEQVLAQSQGGWLSPGGKGGVVEGGGRGIVIGAGGHEEEGGSNAKLVDIIQMLTKARTEYDKSTSEPKEIGGSSVLYGNPNLIKPIPVKPNTQDTENVEPKPLSLATLFGSQHQHHHSPEASPLSPGTATGPASRPSVARSLKYDDAVTSKEGNAETPVIGVRTEGRGGNIEGLLPSPSSSHQQQKQPQHCPAIQKLMQGQRGVGVVGGVLQTVSESPENRLCDNGVPLEHHHHHLYHHHHQQHHLHHHHHHLQQQHQSDPVKRLFQTQPPPTSSNPLPLQQPGSCDHLQPQQHQMFFIPAKPPADAQQQPAAAVQGAGLLTSQVTSDQIIHPLPGLSSQMPGVVSPHELLEKLQLVQQEQSLASHDAPRHCPGLAPRFLGPSQAPSTGSVLGPAPNHTTVIPATAAPTLLLSPSVFTQAKSSGGLSAAPEICPVSSAQQREVKGLSRSQLQAALLHLIQTDSSFLDTIYDAYTSRFAKDCSSKY